MKGFLEFIGDTKHYFKHINEDEDRYYEELPCHIDITADSLPEDDPKLDEFLKSLYAFIENWLYDWKIKHPSD